MTELPRLPFDNPAMIGIAPQMRALQQEGPITRVRTANEDAWLVTRYDEVRTLLADRRLRLSNPNPKGSAKSAARRFMVTLMAGDDHDTEATRHAQVRTLLVPRFSTRRMCLMKPRIEQHVDDLLDQLAVGTPPVDLHRALSFGTPHCMASIQARVRSDGTTAYRVMFRLNARLVGETFDDPKAAQAFAQLVDRIGGQAARDLRDARDDYTDTILLKNGRDHINRLTGVTDGTRKGYRSLARDHINPALGELPRSPHPQTPRSMDQHPRLGHVGEDAPQRPRPPVRRPEPRRLRRTPTREPRQRHPPPRPPTTTSGKWSPSPKTK